MYCARHRFHCLQSESLNSLCYILICNPNGWLNSLCLTVICVNFAVKLIYLDIQIHLCMFVLQNESSMY